jgi:hypothetical protein
MLHAALTFAAEAAKDEPSKTAWYVLGGLLAVWAFVVSAIGISRHEAWPGGDAAMRGVMAISVVLVAAAMTAAVVTG